MTSTEKKALLKEIKSNLHEIEQDITYLNEVTKPVKPENAIGRISRMDAINNMNINKSLLSSKLALKHNLNTVLEKLNEPDFGVCTRCNKNIPYKRIIRVPDSKMCVPCINALKG